MTFAPFNIQCFDIFASHSTRNSRVATKRNKNDFSKPNLNSVEAFDVDVGVAAAGVDLSQQNHFIHGRKKLRRESESQRRKETLVVAQMVDRWIT